MQEFLIHLVVIVLMAGVLLFWAIPFVAVALLFHRYSAAWLAERTRLVAACGIAALGIAPSFDIYRQPHPIWLRWWDGEAVGAGVALLSLVVTWAVIYLQIKSLHRHPKPA